MPGPSAPKVAVFVWQRRIMKKLLRCRQTLQDLVLRIRIILLASKGWTNARIAGYVQQSEATVRLWCGRFVDACAQLGDTKLKQRHQKPWPEQVLSDALRRQAVQHRSRPGSSASWYVACSSVPVSTLSSKTFRSYLLKELSVRNNGTL